MPRLNEIQIRDPYVLREGSTYYLFGSTDPDIWRAPGVGFDVYRSVGGQLTEFDGPYPAFRPPVGFWSERNFWAPEVHPVGGAYYMFATFWPRAGHRGTAVLRAESVMGPYVPWSDGPVTPATWECLDGTLYIDPDGAPWLVFCHEWQQVGDGQVCAMRLAPDLRSAAGEPIVLFTASQAPWAASLPGRAPGSYVTDGPYVVTAPGALLILWSSFGADGSYRLGVARSTTGLLGKWSQSPEPLYSADGGHGMVFTTPGGAMYLALHTPNRTPDERPIFVGVRLTGTGLATTGEVIA